MSPQDTKTWDAEVDWGEPVYLRSSFFGRQRDLSALQEMLADRSVRLITITGPSGVGKSRLAAQLYIDARDAFPDGIVFVSLSAVHDPELVLSFLAKALDLRDDLDLPVLDQLQERLEGFRMLLVLDGFEHVLSASRAITELLSRVSGPVVLATSRAPLRITAEHEYLLAPLELPAADEKHTVEQLRENTAVALFVDRARSVRNTFELTEENAEAVAEVCRRLDGLPLAIELAAARTKILSPQALLARLSNRLQLLTGGPRDVPLRLQTMRDAIAWSHDLLSPEHRAVFRHISVFSGGFNLDEATAIEGIATLGDHSFRPGDGGDPLELFEAIAALVDSSMVLADRSSESDARFIVLETLREFGLEQLEAAGEADEYRRRHAEAFLRVVTYADERIWGPDSYRWVNRLEQEHENLRAALEWSMAHDPDLALKLAGKLWWFWQTRGHLSDGRRWIQRALEAAPYEASHDRLQATFGGGFLAVMQGDPTAAIPYLEQSRKVVTEMGATDAEHEGQLRYMESFVIGGTGEHQAAAEAARISLAKFEESNAAERVPFAHNRLGIELAATGVNAESEEQFRLALEKWRARGSEWGEVTALINLAIAARNRGDYVKAVSDLALCLEPAHRQGDPWGEAETRLTMAGLAGLLGDQTMSVRFQASAERIRQAIGLRLQEYIDPALLDSSTVEERMKDPAFAAAWTEGQSATIEQLVAWANELHRAAASGGKPTPTSAAPAPPPLPAASRFPGAPSILSPRELEVLRLMAEGLSSREIGERLFISPRTATTHVANIFSKLDVDSRASAVTAGFRLGLI
jgi:predicted ATPase/DNA-binding CsgD family transcriptional regulator